jgi:iron complex outermembrane receptor protein
LAGGKVAASAAVFYINWDDLQLNVPNQFVPGQFYIATVGGATSAGVEAELIARPRSDLDIFATLGITGAEFSDGTSANGAAVGGNAVPYTPGYTAMFGGQYTRAITSTITGFGRAEIALNGEFYYDEGNRQSQEAYSIVNFRGGARFNRFFGELWLRNAFDSRYIPIAIPYDFAPSGFIGENGRPRTFGITFGATF